MVDLPEQHKILLVSAAVRAGEDPRVFRRAHERGELVRLHRGAYMFRADWDAMDAVERYRSRVVGAVLAGRTRPTVSHVSAAVMWGIPLVGPLPQYVHVLSAPTTGTRLDGGIRRHGTAFLNVGVEIVGGLRVTSFARTVVELCQMAPFAHAVVALDWALIPSTTRRPKPATTRDELLGMASALGVVHGRRDFLRALEFANPLSGSPGESVSRVTIARAGLPAPELQAEFRDNRGRIGIVDFWWPVANVIGEFDGLGKYIRDEFTHGQATADVILAEKRREDRLRGTATHPGVTRWGWSLANSVDALRSQLIAAGLSAPPGAAVVGLDVRRRGRGSIGA